MGDLFQVVPVLIRNRPGLRPQQRARAANGRAWRVPEFRLKESIRQSACAIVYFDRNRTWASISVVFDRLTRDVLQKTVLENGKPCGGQKKKPGNDLLSHRQAAVPSANQGVNFRVGRAPPEGMCLAHRCFVPCRPRAGCVLRGSVPPLASLRPLVSCWSVESPRGRCHKRRSSIERCRSETLNDTICGITITMEVLR